MLDRYFTPSQEHVPPISSSLVYLVNFRFPLSKNNDMHVFQFNNVAILIILCLEAR